MNREFIANPPLPLWKDHEGKWSWAGLGREFHRIIRGFLRILYQCLIPFNPRPPAPRDPPERDEGLIDDKQLDQCQRIFDEVEAARIHLEQKARATFTLVAFLAPLLASILVFILGQIPANTTSRMVSIIFAFGCSTLLLLGFVSIVRAVSIHTREKLFLDAVIDSEQGRFRKYNKAFHARGLLYCASMNQAMNDHIAQFVKGAHILTALSVIALVVAAVPAAIALPDLPSSPTKAQIVGSVHLSSTELEALRGDVARLSKDIAMLVNRRTTGDWLQRLGARVAKLEASLSQLQEEMDNPSQSGAAPSEGVP